MALRELTIHNFAIIKHLDIEVEEGLTVVTGETGAGKSIVIQALNLLLGARAEADMIRHNEEQCDISAVFSIDKLHAVQDWLQSKQYHDAESTHCLIRRIIRRNRPTRCFINDQATTLASLKELGLLLVDLHGQAEHQSLLRRTTQRQIIDQFAEHQTDLDEMANTANKCLVLQGELNTLTQDRSQISSRLELLSFQLTELDEANFAENEYEQLNQEHDRLANAQELINGIELAIDGLFLNDKQNVSSELGKHINQLSTLTEFDARLLPANDLLNSSLAQIDEARHALETTLNRLELDPERLQEVSQRLELFINLARKHRCPETQLEQKHQSLREEYERLNQHIAAPDKLQAQLALLNAHYTKIAKKVSRQRQVVAQQLSDLISEQMQSLGMQGGQLSIQVNPKTDQNKQINEHGIDQIEYLVSTNAGVPLKNLQKTASGGELSRISLAIQVITSTKSDTPTLVFDEVDVGVGGNIASVVGKRLRDLGTHAQVICITHQPQVASQGHQHLFVDKVQQDESTYSTLVLLDEELRALEIARMLGGETITERTKAHAQEMLGTKL